MKLKSWCSRFSDEDIRQSRRPQNYAIAVDEWPPGAWDKWWWHAYHIKQLAHVMRRLKKWIGPPVIIYDGSIDGNHRVRAVIYNRKNFGVRVNIPPEPIDKRKKK